MGKVFTISGLFVLLSVIGSYSQTKSLSGYKTVADGFVENKGQVIDQNYQSNPSVKYLLCRPGFNIQLRQMGFSYDTYTDSVVSDQELPVNKKWLPIKDKEQFKKIIRHYNRVDIKLIGCNPNAQLVAEEKSTAYFNYLTANMPKGGISDIYYYQNIMYKNIYPHIDLEFSTSIENLTEVSTIPVEYRFIVHPGGNSADIRLEYKGANKVSLINNKLVLNVAKRDFTESIPHSYLIEPHNDKENTDIKKPVQVNYTMLGNNVFGFSLASDIKINADLVIDPVPNLLWGTYYGGLSLNSTEGNAIALDANDNVYITGVTDNISNIATAGASQVTYSGGMYDAFVAKFNTTGTSLLWGTYYGGTNWDWATGIAVDANNNPYITGYTSSSSGIATLGTYQATYLAGINNYDAFIAKFNSTGTSLLWGTYCGSSGGATSNAIVLDANDNVYITGWAFNASGIATAGAYKTNISAGGDIYIAKFNPSGTSLLWGTYYGSSYMVTSGITLDTGDNVYITGQADDSSIGTAGAYRKLPPGTWGNAFIAKFNPSGTSLLWGTYYGGEYEDNPTGIAVDANNNAYITGWTWNSSGIATSGAYQTTFLGDEGEEANAFVAKFNSTGSSLLWGTYYGGKYNTVGTGIVLDATDNVYITGYTVSSTQIATTGAYQTTIGDATDAFIAKFNPLGTCLLWGSYYGGINDNTGTYGSAIAIDANANIYITGLTNNNSAIATPGAYQTINNGSNDAFVAKFDSTYVPTYTIVTTPSDTTICAGTNVTITASGAINYTWGPATNLSCTGCPNPIATPTSTTTYTVTDSAQRCAISAIATVKVCPKPSPFITGKDSLCKGYQDNLTAAGGTYYRWSNGETGAQYKTGPIDADSTVLIIAFDSLGKTGCSDTTLFKIKPLIAPTVSIIPPPIGCKGSPVTIQANATGPGSFSYSWSPGKGTTSNITVNDSNVTYTVHVTNGCEVEDSATLKADIPVLSACCNTTIVLGDDTIISASGNGIKSYQWEPNDGLSCDSCPSVTVSPTVTTTYTVIGMDSMNCQVERLITIEVELPCFKLTVPNVFTPDYAGPYGVNNVLYIPTNNIDIWSLTVYDRWGKEVYKSSNPNQYWTGNTESGGEAPSGVYDYTIDVTCQGASYKKDGFVQLIR